MAISPGALLSMDSRGVLFAFGAYFIWGLFPIYWKLLQHVPAVQLIGHRVAWSFVLLAIIFLAAHSLSELCRLAADRKIVGIYSIAAVLMGVNWLIYVWSVNAGYIVEASLGYFINPLLSVLLGVLFLRERLRRLQWVSVGLAAAGVLYLTLAYGRPPWISLSLAVTFGFYGLFKKMAPLRALDGLTLETGILFIPALGFLAWQEWTGQGAFLHAGPVSDLLMAGAGLVTTIPLLLFASAARRIPLTTIGIMQYITPTSQFLLGVLVYGEAFGSTRALGFGIIWAALIIFAVESFRSRRPYEAKSIPEF